MAELHFFTGTMDSGKSTLALQTNHNHAARGRVGRIFTTHDRAGEEVVYGPDGLLAWADRVKAAVHASYAALAAVHQALAAQAGPAVQASAMGAAAAPRRTVRRFIAVFGRDANGGAKPRLTRSRTERSHDRVGTAPGDPSARIRPRPTSVERR